MGRRVATAAPNAQQEKLPCRTERQKRPFRIPPERGRAFISPCCTASIREFLSDGQLWLVGRVAGHGWSAPWPGRIEDINDTGTLVDADGSERPVYWTRGKGGR